MWPEWGATFLVDKHAKALNLASAAVLLIGTFMFAGPALAQNPDTCAGGQLGPGNPANPQDLLISGECHVGSGVYSYRNVNIIAKGSLVFEENVRNEKIDFWASSILVENGGSLLTGLTERPFGINGGVLTIHLWGKDQGVSGAGITCKSPNCGIPSEFKKCGHLGKVSLPGGVCDYFYPYKPLPFDDTVNKAEVQFRWAILAIRCSPFPMAAR